MYIAFYMMFEYSSNQVIFKLVVVSLRYTDFRILEVPMLKIGSELPLPRFRIQKSMKGFS